MTEPSSIPLEHADDVMIRSEEELDVHRRRRARERVRIGKRIVTEQRTITVEVRREELFLEREPLGSAHEVEPAPAEDADGVIELVLHEEELVIDKRVVPRERVRVVRELATEQREIVEELRREEVVLEEERFER